MFLPSGLAAGPTRSGISRRAFLRRTCLIAAASVGLPKEAAAEFVRAAAAGRKPSVIWLHFQECTGCTESLLRTSHPGLDDLVLDLISLDYHETVFAAAGHQAEAAKQTAMRENAGKYVLVVEGAIPTRDGGIYCKVGGKTAQASLEECAANAGAIIAIGSCASWGGIPSSGPNPTGATGVKGVLKGKPVVNLPGCPANPYNLLGTVLQYATYGTLPELDAEGRPKFAYGRTIHEDCPRRPHFDAGEFAESFGDAGHRAGYCLYKLGCKGPQTYANCSLQPFCEVPGAWPIGIGHPCFGCTMEGIAFTVPLFQNLPVPHPNPPATYAPIAATQGEAGLVAAGVAGAALGAVAGGAFVLGRKLSRDTSAETAGASRPAGAEEPVGAREEV
ncbi:MAG TPA: hydrogenase small subunit [Longimicrobium sp.]|nr:hydrogenase small subunit [Longimicrobium sp.]